MIFYKPQLICQLELDKEGKYFYPLNFQEHLPIAEIINNQVTYNELRVSITMKIFKKLGLYII